MQVCVVCVCVCVGQVLIGKLSLGFYTCVMGQISREEEQRERVGVLERGGAGRERGRDEGGGSRGGG